MKVGRNELCPCGSGRKHKRCCGHSRSAWFGGNGAGSSEGSPPPSNNSASFGDTSRGTGSAYLIPPVDRKVLVRVSKLLAMAEGTTNEHEAIAFFEKAQELMLAHAIDEATLAAARSPGGSGAGPVKRDVWMRPNSPGLRARWSLLTAVAMASRCRSWRVGTASGQFVVCGFAADADFVVCLFDSICRQLEGSLSEALASPGRTSHGITFRTQFTSGYVSRVVERLLDKDRRDRDALPATTDLVLRDREAIVEEFLEREGHWFTRPSASYVRADRHAYAAGRTEGSRALLSV